MPLYFGVYHSRFPPDVLLGGNCILAASKYRHSDCSMSSEIGGYLTLVVDMDDPVASGRFGQPPDQHAPRTARLPSRGLKLRPVEPSVVRGHRLSGNGRDLSLGENWRLVDGRTSGHGVSRARMAAAGKQPQGNKREE
jgi:hypothetical protein